MSSFIAQSPALEQICFMASSISPSQRRETCHMLIENALRHPDIFAFGELLMVENISMLLADHSDKHVRTLALFAYGTYQDYQRIVEAMLSNFSDSLTIHPSDNPGSFISLQPDQIKKLKLLSIVTMASKTKELSYAEAMQHVDISDMQEFEDIVIEAMYAALIRGRLDHRLKVVEIQYANGRDVEPEEIPMLRLSLENWMKRTNELVSLIDAQIASVNEAYTAAKTDKEANEAALQRKIKEISKAASSASSILSSHVMSDDSIMILD